ncbi:MAG: hypothetical protein HZC39_13340 [Chloroflexi bacterium]|nr:hypothetical protein [Chloroflexota bacterium]MBI5704511.1 hypothetical protein [Chloroflexota bacterium]GER78866.1 conserved hypothetical protein [Candidatus Denitrolinea symbiosum]
MLEQILLIIGAAIIGILGTLHLQRLIFTNSFSSHDSRVMDAMKGDSPVLTEETSMWNAWIGFNASHSLGAMIFSASHILLASRHMDVIRDTKVFSLLAVVMGAGYLYLAKKYWFRLPFTGILIATLCFLVSAILIYV